jgi:chromosome segregation ATPase
MLRNAAEQGKEVGGKGDDKEESKIPVFWKVFGSTLLSISAMVAVTAYQSLSSNLAEIRNEMASLNGEMRKEYTRLAEQQSELVKKDEAGSRIQTVWRNVNELKEDKKELVALKERCAALSEMHRAGEEERRKLAGELQSLREQRIQQEERRALTVELSVLRERLAGLEGKQGAATPTAKDE